MIKSCQRCGGLFATVTGESFAGTPCSCVRGSVWQQVQALVAYAKAERPDPYEVIRRAQEITEVWNAKESSGESKIQAKLSGGQFGRLLAYNPRYGE